MAAIAEHDRVMLTRAVPRLGLRAGDVGTVVYVHAAGQGYEVEFVTTGGKTLGIEGLEAEAVRAVDGGRVWNARELVGAEK